MLPTAPRTDPYVKDSLIRLLPQVEREIDLPDRAVKAVKGDAALFHIKVLSHQLWVRGPGTQQEQEATSAESGGRFTPVGSKLGENCADCHPDRKSKGGPSLSSFLPTKPELLSNKPAESKPATGSKGTTTADPSEGRTFLGWLDDITGQILGKQGDIQLLQLAGTLNSQKSGGPNSVPTLSGP